MKYGTAYFLLPKRLVSLKTNLLSSSKTLLFGLDLILLRIFSALIPQYSKTDNDNPIILSSYGM
jgi:hypothetical protein